MNSPEPGSIFIDNDPRNRALRFVRVDNADPHQPGYAVCTTWYDEPGGPAAPRRGVRIKVVRLGSTARSNYRAADVGPNYGRPDPA